LSITAKITRKGQVTIPKEMREVLRSDVVEFEASGEGVLIRPVKSVGGSLKAYAKKPVPFSAVREKVWREVAAERAKKHPGH
jgi:AbrB family looped-hinge helix DNA binding protein